MTSLFKLYGIKKYLNSLNEATIKEHNNVNVVSVNVRCISKDDKKIRNWLFRASYLKQAIIEEEPDIICFQELTIEQMNYFKKVFTQFDYVYMKRDKKINSETNAIFFNKNKFKLLDSSSFFLSETYNKMSNSWNASCYRICTYAYLEYKNKNKIAIFNTHLDHRVEAARINGIKLIKQRVIDLGYKDIPHLIVGDMNAHYGSDTINTLFEDYIDASAFNNQQDIITYNGYGDVSKQEKIDYFALKNIQLLNYEVICRIYEDNIYPSDHNQIKITIKL